MVLIGTDPQPADYPFPERMTLVAVMGPGKRYSVGIVECPFCRRSTVIALWQDVCRSCGACYRDGQDTFMGSWLDGMYRPWRRVERPVGRGR